MNMLQDIISYICFTRIIEVAAPYIVSFIVLLCFYFVPHFNECMPDVKYISVFQIMVSAFWHEPVIIILKKETLDEVTILKVTVIYDIMFYERMKKLKFEGFKFFTNTETYSMILQ